MGKSKLGIGFIQEACDATGISRQTYYDALKAKKEGVALSYKQIAVLTKLRELKESAVNNIEKLD